MPLLELDNGDLITEVSVILQYIADQRPETGLAPANGTIERVRLQEWLSYLNSDLHMTMGLFFSPELCLLQVANAETTAVIDPLAIENLQSLFDLLYDPSIT